MVMEITVLGNKIEIVDKTRSWDDYKHLCENYYEYSKPISIGCSTWYLSATVDYVDQDRIIIEIRHKQNRHYRMEYIIRLKELSQMNGDKLSLDMAIVRAWKQFPDVQKSFFEYVNQLHNRIYENDPRI